MGVHNDGLGSDWDAASPDVDQNQGLDYREFNGLKAAVRKRLAKGHVDFADDTAGGEHVPGGCGVFGIEITSSPTDNLTADNNYRGHGLVWTYDNGQNGILYCNTAPAESTDYINDWTVVLMHPDKQWGGGDVSWTGAHEFQARVDITGVLGTNDVSISGNLHCASDMDVTGALTVTETVTCATGASFGMDVSGTGAEFDSTLVAEAVLKAVDWSSTGDVVMGSDFSCSGHTNTVSILSGPYPAEIQEQLATGTTRNFGVAATDGLVTIECAMGNGGGYVFVYSPYQTDTAVMRAASVSYDILYPVVMTIAVKKGDDFAVKVQKYAPVTIGLCPFGMASY